MTTRLGAALLALCATAGCARTPSRVAATPRHTATPVSLAPTLVVGERYRLERLGYVPGDVPGAEDADVPLEDAASSHLEALLEVISVQARATTIVATVTAPVDNAGLRFRFELVDAAPALVEIEDPGPLTSVEAESEAELVLVLLAPRPATPVAPGGRWRRHQARCQLLGVERGVARVRSHRTEWNDDDASFGIVARAQSALYLRDGLAEHTTRRIEMYVSVPGQGAERLEPVVTYQDAIRVRREGEPIDGASGAERQLALRGAHSAGEIR